MESWRSSLICYPMFCDLHYWTVHLVEKVLHHLQHYHDDCFHQRGPVDPLLHLPPTITSSSWLAMNQEEREKREYLMHET